ncbi:MAG: pyridoxamine 5'-phosphate oxidase family protein [Saprospiraceae bacterium]|nr:pyridoxamine 5'-phosphate oxidase family protein [Saprospiraceae bacterium]
MLGELNELQIKNVLSSQALGRMACAEGEFPYIIPVTYAYDGDFIYGQTNEGKKLDILRKNPNVCFEVDSMFDMRKWQCAIVHGKFEELSGLEADNARNCCSIVYSH